MTNPSPQAALHSLQQRFAILDLGGEIRAIDLQRVAAIRAGTRQADLALYRKPDADLMMTRLLEAQPIACNAKKVVSDFWKSASTTIFNEIAFDPGQTPPTTLNFWSGPPVAPRPGNWRVLRDYIRDVICAGNLEVYEYLICLLSHMVQRPGDKPGVMIVFIGGQGTGKGVFFMLLRAIWPRTVMQVSNVDQVIGKFNAQLERNYVICMDEALFAGDRRAMDRLKSAITEPYISIEQKYQPSRSIKSVHRFFAATNHDHFGHIERDDRRFMFLRVSNHRQQDTVYFGRVTTEISNPATIGALLYYLRRRDLTSFNVRAKPKSDENVEQKLMSLEGFDRYLYEVLLTGSLSGADGDSPVDPCGWNKEVFVATTALMFHYKEFDKQAQRYRPIQSNQVGRALQRLIPSTKLGCRTTQAGGTAKAEQKRGFTLPDLATARREFAAAIGGDLTWD